MIFLFFSPIILKYCFLPGFYIYIFFFFLIFPLFSLFVPFFSNLLTQGRNVVRCHFFPLNPPFFFFNQGGVVEGKKKKTFFFFSAHYHPWWSHNAAFHYIMFSGGPCYAGPGGHVGVAYRSSRWKIFMTMRRLWSSGSERSSRGSLLTGRREPMSPWWLTGGRNYNSGMIRLVPSSY